MTTTDSEALDTFRRNIRLRIDAGHISIAELARRAKIDRACLSNIINGKTGITLANADQVAKALGMRLDELLSEESDAKNS